VTIWRLRVSRAGLCQIVIPAKAGIQARHLSDSGYVIPAKAGIQPNGSTAPSVERDASDSWIPAFAGMTASKRKATRQADGFPSRE